MSVAHLARMVADLAEGLPDDDAKALAEVLERCMAQLGFVPVEKVLSLDSDWVEASDGYDPVTFDDDVPDELTEENAVVEHDGELFVYGHDGEMAYYWKYVQKVQA